MSVTDDLHDLHVIGYTLLCLMQKRHDCCSVHDAAEMMMVRLLLDRIAEMKLPSPERRGA